VRVCGVAAATALVAWVAWELIRPRPTLDGVTLLLQAGKFEKAQQRLRAYLREHPRELNARLMVVDCQLDRYDRNNPPDLALLRAALADAQRLRPGSDPRKNALVQLRLGKVHDRLSQYDQAETAWLEALRRDPQVPEAGWQLLGLYDWQGRLDAARALALRMHAIEPDPRDRVGWLLEVVREDVQRPAPRGLIEWLEPIVREHPGDLHSTLTLGVALTREGVVERGLTCLQDAVRAHPLDPDAWLALCTGLEEAGRFDALAAALEQLPEPLSADVRFLRFRGEVAQEHREWDRAVALYRAALESRPHDLGALYRLARALRLSGRREEADRYDQQARVAADARKELRALYDQEIAPVERSLAPDSRPDLYQRIAELREHMGLHEEAAAWNRLLADRRPDPARTAQTP
jgi:tetratricopeptide (TPR) repeat protein